MDNHDGLFKMLYVKVRTDSSLKLLKTKSIMTTYINQQTQNNCIAFLQCTNVMCLLGTQSVNVGKESTGIFCICKTY